VPKKGDPDSMSANDFFKLIDKSIPKFKDMIVVIGGCYSSGFSDSAESSKAYKSGNGFALMAATDRKCPREEAGGSERGNSFVQGIVNGMYPGNNDVQKPTQPGTVTDGMTTAKSRIERDAANKHAERPIRRLSRPEAVPTYGSGQGPLPITPSCSAGSPPIRRRPALTGTTFQKRGTCWCNPDTTRKTSR